VVERLHDVRAGEVVLHHLRRGRLLVVECDDVPVALPVVVVRVEHDLAANGAAGMSSIAFSGTVTIAQSAASAASAGVAARASRRAGDEPASVSGPRELLMTTS
jgi:hypothetical protein